MATPPRKSIATSLVALLLLSPGVNFPAMALHMPMQTPVLSSTSSAPAPTEPPSMELIKRRLSKRTVTSICSDWTISGGLRQPECYNGQTCIFQTATDGHFYEGCGVPGIAYNWVTECFNYPQSGTPPVSQIYCPSSAPYCGYFAFAFDPQITYFNFGCSTATYGIVVSRADNVNRTSSPTTTPTVVQTGTALPTGTTSVSATASSDPTIGSHETSAQTPVGTIVGGVVGGLALLIIGLLLWYCVHRRRARTTRTGGNTMTTKHDQHNQSIPPPANLSAFQEQQHIFQTNVKPLPGVYQNAGGPGEFKTELDASQISLPRNVQHNRSVFLENLDGNTHSYTGSSTTGPESANPSYWTQERQPLQQQYYAELETPSSTMHVSPMTTQSSHPPSQPHG